MSVFMQPVPVNALPMTLVWVAVMVSIGLVLAWQSRRNLSIKRLQRAHIVNALLIAVSVAAIGHTYFMVDCSVFPSWCCDDWWAWICYL